MQLKRDLLRGCAVFFFVFALVASASAQSPEESEDSSSPSRKELEEAQEDSSSGRFEPKRLDGVNIEAVETYLNPKRSELGIGLALFTFDEFFTGFGLNAGYTHYFNKSFAWELVNGSFIFTVEKNLTTELAENFGVNPEKIERPEYLITSNVLFVHSYGKLVFLKEYIRYFRSSIIGGAGILSTNKQNDVVANLGLRFDAYISDSFAWRFEVRDAMSFSDDFENNVAFHIATGLSF